MKPRFSIFNKSSEDMSDLETASIDLAVMDPPYNIGLKYGSKIDETSQANYEAMIRKVISETSRVLKSDGLAVLLLPEAIKKENAILHYPSLYSGISERAGLTFQERFRFRVTEEDFSCIPMSDILSESTPEKTHTQEMVGLVCSKEKVSSKIFPTNRTYGYKQRETHPCPYPTELIKDILDTFFVPGYKVLDPFMGTAGLGAEVLRRGGTFVGYELAKPYFDIAKNKLNGDKELPLPALPY